MNVVHSLTLALALAFAAQVHADYLPDPAAAEAALWATPLVSQARGEFTAQTLKSQGLQHGREEWMVGADVAQRRIEMPRDNQTEWGVALSRPLRLPARAAADRELAGALTAHSEASLGEALHENGRKLLALWFDWLNEASQAQLRLQQQQAATREQQARNRPRAQFPDLPVAAEGALPSPLSPDGTADDYVDAVLEHNHELFRARRQAEVLQAEARQLARRRSADPNVGIFYKNEAGGSEHVLGLNVGLTLPGRSGASLRRRPNS